MQVTDATLETAAKAAGWLDKLPIAGVAVLALFALAWVFRLYVTEGQEHRAVLGALNDKHAAELAASVEARMRLSIEFESTIRALFLAARAKKKARPIEKTG